jgi:hypothetical protein
MFQDDNYDPYDEKNYLKKCHRGYYIGSTRWCCKECWLEQRVDYIRPSLEEFIKEYFNEEFNFTFKSEYNPISEDWKILKLKPPKTNIEIKKQYKKLALIYHPDKPNGNHNLFTQLNSSYNTLIDTY